ncbi:MAG: DMT family transporter [Candidatus Ornithospirochaeta sp.]|nr:DMT family transporter [Candidatus Ornithospirochaeta sp.]
MEYAYCLISFLTGAVISVMVVGNTALGNATSNEVSIIINQIVGIALLSAIMLLGRKNQTINPPRRKAGWYLWFGGILGLVVITCNYYSVTGAGTTIAMASAVFGQCLAGLFFDLTGLMGMEKHRITGRRLASIAVSFAGILLMFALSEDGISFAYAIIGIGAGIVTMTQMVYNSLFAKHKGAFFSARNNVISGLMGILLFSAIAVPGKTMEALSQLGNVNPLVIVLGGTLGCVVVVCCNTVIPRIPASVSSVLMSSGQVLTAVLLDACLYGRFELSLLIGALVMVAGIAMTLTPRKMG